jgi:hypothetical protein
VGDLHRGPPGMLERATAGTHNREVRATTPT